MIAVRSFVVTAASVLVAGTGRNDVRRGYRPGPGTVSRASSARLPGERLVEHLLGHRAGQPAAGAAGDLGVGALEHHGDRVARRVGGRVGDDPGVGPLRLTRPVE